MKLDCHVIEDLLPLYQDQVCSEESQALVEEHLRDCESCSRLLKAMGEPEERKPIYKDEAKPIEEVSKAVRKINYRFAWRACLLTVLVFLIAIGGYFGYQQYYDYYYVRNDVVVPADEVSVVLNEVLENDVYHYQLSMTADYDESLTGFMTTLSAGGEGQGTPETCYVQFSHPRKYTKIDPHPVTCDLYLYETESGNRCVSTDSPAEYNSITMNLSDIGISEDLDGNPITRLVYLDNEGNEQLLFDRTDYPAYVPIPTDQVSITWAETTSSGVLHYQIQTTGEFWDSGPYFQIFANSEFTNVEGMEGYQPGTCYVQFIHARYYRPSHYRFITMDVYAYQMESGAWICSNMDYGDSAAWEELAESAWTDIYGNPITRLVYLDDEGNELVLFDANENYFAQGYETAK